MARDTTDLILNLLNRLCADQLARLSRADLQCATALEITSLKATGIIASVEKVRHGAYLLQDDGRLLRVVKAANTAWGIDEDDPEATPIVLKDADLDRYTINTEKVARLLAERIGLEGRVEVIEPELIHMGSAGGLDGEAAWVLVLTTSQSVATRLLWSVPSRLPTGYKRIAAFCPGVGLSPTAVRELQAAGVHPVGWDGASLPIATGMPRATIPTDREIEHAVFVLDVPERKLRYGGVEIDLTLLESGVVAALAAQPQRVMDRYGIASSIPDVDAPTWIQQVNKHIASVRKKLQERANAEGVELSTDPKELLKSVRSSGYKLCLPPREVVVKQ